MDSTTEKIENWTAQMKNAIPFWQAWAMISQYQRDIFENYGSVMFAGFRPWLQLAPNNLNQSILPWTFSLFQFTKEIKGSPDKEYKILTEVAGYGSQLGTIMDYLEVLERKGPLDLKSLDPEEIYKVYKFRQLVAQVNKVKGNGVEVIPPTRPAISEKSETS